MIKELLCVGLMSLTACTPTPIYMDPPTLPILDEKVKEPCPPLPLLTDTSIGLIATEDANAAYEYAKCQEKNRALVKIHEDARLTMIAYQKKIEEARHKK